MTDPLVRRAARVAVLLTLAHHPLCRHFDGDVMRLGPVRVCIGCVATWPLYVVAFAATPFTPFIWMAPGHLVLLGLLLGVPQAAAAGVGVERSWSVLAKVLGAPGLALATWGVLLHPLLAVRIVLAFGATVGFALLLALRARRMLKTCGACVWRREWEACPGMVGYTGAWSDPPAPVGAASRGNLSVDPRDRNPLEGRPQIQWVEPRDEAARPPWPPRAK